MESPGTIEGENRSLPLRHRRAVRREQQREELEEHAPRTHCRATVRTVRLSLMSAEEAPTPISTGSASTTQRWAPGFQYAREDAARENATVRVSPGPSVTRW